MPKPKHIVWITPGFPADENDSTCIPPLQLFARQLSREIHLHIITLYYPFRQGPYQWHDIEVYGCRVKAPKGIYNLLIWWNAWKYLKKMNKQYEISLLHSFWLNDTALLGKLFSRRFHLPHITTLMGQDARHSTNPYLRWLAPAGWPTVTLSGFHNQVLKKNTGETAAHVIPWGIGGESPAATTRDIDILGVGALIKLKNYEAFIRVVSVLKQEGLRLQACLIGTGPQEVYLRKMIEASNLQDEIELTGKIPRPEVLAYMARSKLLLHPSVYESQGYVFNEALLCGMCIASYAVGIARPGDRWWVAASEADLTKGVRKMLEDAGRFEPLVIHSMQDTVQKYLSIYRGLE